MGKEEFKVSDLNTLLDSFDKVGDVMTKSIFSQIDGFINTGNYALNAQISGSIFKGIPNNRQIELAGSSGVGKTFLALNICREAQKDGYYIIYCDSENAIDKDTMLKFGINTDLVRYVPMFTIKDFRNYVVQLTTKLEDVKKKNKTTKILIVLDSIGNLATEKERTDAQSGSDKKDMTRASDIKSLFRLCTMDLAKNKIPFIFTNHVYTTMGLFSLTESSGGSGIKYAASISVFLSKKQLKDKEDTNENSNATGIIVTSKLKKSRFTRPIPVSFHISFYHGMNRFVGLENYISWDVCGIGRGKLQEVITEEPELNDDGTPILKKNGTPKMIKVSKGYEFIEDKKGNTFAVKHLGKNIKGSKIFSEEVFTSDVLEKIDNQIIQKTFQLPDILNSNEDLNNLLFEDDNECDDENII